MMTKEAKFQEILQDVNKTRFEANAGELDITMPEVERIYDAYDYNLNGVRAVVQAKRMRQELLDIEVKLQRDSGVISQEREPLPKKEEKVVSEKTEVDTSGFVAELQKLIKPVDIDVDRVKQEVLDYVRTNIKPVRTHKVEFKDLSGTPKISDNVHVKYPRLLMLVGGMIKSNRPRPILLVGPAGSGKTYSAKKLADDLGLPFYTQSNSVADLPHDSFGHLDANGNFISKPFVEAFRNGGIFLDDEFDLAPAGVQARKNMAIDNRRASFADSPNTLDEAHPNFIYIGAANTFGTGRDLVYEGAQKQNGALMSRFIIIEWQFDEDHERQLVSNDDWVDLVQAVRKASNSAQFRRVVSPRASIMGAELIEYGFTPSEAARHVLTPGWSKDEISRIKSDGNVEAASEKLGGIVW